MIGLSHPPFAGNPPSPRPEEDGIARLWSDLTESPGAIETAPTHLLEKLLERIEGEPPRVETDAEGHVLAINPAFIELCGYTFSELVGRKPGGMLQGAESDPQVVAQLRAAVRAGESCLANLINYHKDGSPYRVLIELEPIRYEDGSLQGFRATETKLPLA